MFIQFSLLLRQQNTKNYLLKTEAVALEQWQGHGGWNMAINIGICLGFISLS